MRKSENRNDMMTVQATSFFFPKRFQSCALSMGGRW